MEMEKAASWWNELPFDFQAEICARMPVEFVYTYRMICKQWNDFLSSNYLLTRWAEESLNANQTRLIVCDFTMKTPCMAFCFYTRTWINSCLDLSFLKDGDWRDDGDWRHGWPGMIYFKESVGGLILVGNKVQHSSRLINPYTRTFVEILDPQRSEYLDCIVVDEKDNETTYKVVAVVGDRIGEQLVEIYEPSQKRWKIAGYLPENVRVKRYAEIFYWNGTFYTQCWAEDGRRCVDGIGCFTIPLEEASDSALTPNPIPMHFAPFPRKLRKGGGRWQMITCLSRLLVISANWISVRKAGGQRKRKHVDVISVWEFKFKNEEDHPVALSNSTAWEWVKIAQMPSSFREEWEVKMKGDYYYFDCRAVGNHICFAHSLFGYSGSREVDDVFAYNLIDNTWSWLPSCPLNRRCCVGCDHYEDPDYRAIGVEPNLLIKVQ